MLSLFALPTALLLFLIEQSESRSIIRTSRFDSTSVLHGIPSGQQPLNSPFASLTSTPPQHVTQEQHFDARENSIGVLFTTSRESSPLHLWLPFEKKVFTRDAPILPLHPLTARITTMITSTPELAKPEVIERIECDVWMTSSPGAPMAEEEKRKVSFSRADGLVHLMLGREVESYECHS